MSEPIATLVAALGDFPLDPDRGQAWLWACDDSRLIWMSGQGFEHLGLEPSSVMPEIVDPDEIAALVRPVGPAPWQQGVRVETLMLFRSAGHEPVTCLTRHVRLRSGQIGWLAVAIGAPDRQLDDDTAEPEDTRSHRKGSLGSSEASPDEPEMSAAPEDGTADPLSGSDLSQTAPAWVRADLSSVVPLRFIWQTDASGKFVHISRELAEAVGPEQSILIGLSWPEAVQRFGLLNVDSVASGFESRDTWTADPVLWPVQDCNLAVPVDLAGMLVLEAGKFAGFRGYGIARLDASEAYTRTPPIEDEDEELIVEAPERGGEVGIASLTQNDESANGAFEAANDALIREALGLSNAPEDGKTPDVSAPDHNGEAEPALHDPVGIRDDGEALTERSSDAVADVTREATESPRTEDTGGGLDSVQAGPGDGENSTDVEADEAPHVAPQTDIDVATSEPSDQQTLMAGPPSPADAQTLASASQTATDTQDDAAVSPNATSDPTQSPDASESGPLFTAKAVGYFLPYMEASAQLAGADLDPVEKTDESQEPRPDAISTQSAPQSQAEDVPRQSLPLVSTSAAAEQHAGSLSANERSAFRAIAQALKDYRPESVPEPLLPMNAAQAVQSPKGEISIEEPAPSEGTSPAQEETAFAVEDSVPIDDHGLSVEDMPLAALEFRDGFVQAINADACSLLRKESVEAVRADVRLASFWESPAITRNWAVHAIQGDDGETVLEACRRQSMVFLRPVRATLDASSYLPEEDVGALRTQLRELASVVDTAADGIIWLDAKGQIESLNRSGEALFGFEQGEVKGKHLTTLLEPESHAAARDYIERLRTNTVAALLNDGLEVVGRERHGGRIPMSMTLGRLGDEGGAVRFCAVLKDVTIWKRAVADLSAAKKEADEANQQKTDFLAKISHEIRTPLNAILGFAQVMMSETFGPLGNERYRQYAKDIHTSGEHVISLVNDLLDLSKIAAGKLELQFASVDLNSIVTGCVAMIQPQANAAKVIVRSQLSQMLPNVVADERSVRQIVLNLLSNSAKFTEPGGQVVVVTTLTEKGEVAIRVRDTGIGMTKDELKQALEPFRQTAAARSRGGTGLGLPLTKALVEANRAAFSIESEPRVGTSVEVTFPSTRVLAE